jgi:carboxyl-terminal processing protease
MKTPEHLSKTWRAGTLVVLVAGAGLVGYVAGRLQAVRLRSFPLLAEVQTLIEEQFLGALPDRQVMQRGVARGLVQSLGDPYSLLLDPAGRELETNALSGEYGGIGADVMKDDLGVFRLLPWPQGPAARAGILESDVLRAVDGASVDASWSIDDVLAALRGPPGSHLSLLIGSEVDPRLFDLILEVYSLPTVSSYLYPDRPRIGVVRVSLFSATTAGDVHQAVQGLIDRGAGALVLDLRDNPGGLLDSAVDSARLFLADGPVASESRSDDSHPTYDVEAPGPWPAMPLIIVVNRATASAAEVLAGALQARGRALLAGEATLGKGSVQSVFSLSDGSSLHLTTAVWLLPDGSRLPEGGLSPDIAVESAAGDPEAGLRAAADRLQDEMR